MQKFLLTVSTAAILTFSYVGSAIAMEMDHAKMMYENAISTWLNNPVVINAIKAQNEKHANLGQADIDTLDKSWRADDATVIDPILNNDLSTYLQGIVESGNGLYSEIIIMDNKGLNVGQSAKTSDFWQGDEEKFTESYSKGANTIHLSDVEFDESSQTYQVQLSVTISDGDVPIGAATIGIDAEAAE